MDRLRVCVPSVFCYTDCCQSSAAITRLCRLMASADVQDDGLHKV